MRRVISALPLLFTMLFLGGCLDGGSSGGDDSLTGRLTVVGVEGLYYVTASHTGTTSADGEFRYYEGETISFFLGKDGLLLAADVPAKSILTPLDFTASNREQLYAAGENENNLSTHRLVETRLAQNDAATINLTRLLLLLDEDKTTQLADSESPKNNIRITERVISQFKTYLQQIRDGGGAVDFTKAPGLFAATSPASAITQIIEQICFFPEGDLECQQPHPQSVIDAAEEEIQRHPPNTPEREAAIAEAERLRNENGKIEGGIRYLDNIDLDKVQTFLQRQTNEINSQLARDYYITPFEFTIPATDTSIKTVTIHSYKGDLALTGLEAIETNPSAVALHSWSWQTREVDFFVTGEPGSEGEVRISFRPDGDYRWYQMQVRPVITD